MLGVVRILYQLQQTVASSDRQGPMAGSHPGLKVGEEAPDISTVDLSGTRIRSEDFLGHPTALLFISPSCQSCTDTIDVDIKYLKHKADGNVIVICRASHNECVQFAQRYRLDTSVIVDKDDIFSRSYHITSIPSAVVIGPDNHIQSYGQPRREKSEEAVGEMVVQAVS